ncbi:Transposase, Mutator family [Paracoccus seriniphilus]|uniref:Transposase, Mutator family n=1 Tax=Paracoccus seriniphilus TaxID=184748 RepID=A0A239Q219_9RHOB|nr:Transposase, Mutator family [Paracoccus seriniphilus]
MSESTITQLPDPSGFAPDPFTDVLHDGARKLIEQAIHAELATLMAAFSGERLEDGRARLVRYRHIPEREMTSIGPVPVKVPRVRDRGIGDDKITFTPSILPRYLRKTKSVEELLPWLYLKGVSTGNWEWAKLGGAGCCSAVLAGQSSVENGDPHYGDVMGARG